MMKRHALVLFAALILPAAARSAEPAISLFVASHAYVVSISPVDKESRDADNSILYQRQAGEREWREMGECRKTVLSDGDVRFTREVGVEADGIYYYTSRPVVGGKVASPPQPESPPQAVVKVDTIAPEAAITAPVEGQAIDPGQPVTLTWTGSDENLAPAPATLSFTTDGGRSWTVIGTDLPAGGTLPWIAPRDLPGPAVIRLAVVDLAGNVGRDLRGLKPAPPPPPPVVTPPLPAPAETVVIDKPEPPAVEPGPEIPGISETVRDTSRSWLYYLMAVNLMRQNKPDDALQYYWLSVKEDPDFIDAWADIGLAYIDLGACKTAREVVENTRDKAPERIDLMHLMGETYHAEGMALLGEARTAEDRKQAKGLIDQAVEWYGRALDKAAKEWRLAEQAASFYRLGEVCYYVNMDRDGARAYWKKILELHSPTPNADLVLWSPPGKRERARQRYQRYTYMRVSLEAWQNWARGYLEQMDARERAGIIEMMPAQRLTAAAPQPLLYGSNAMNPGRDDGRSLFSLPTQLGSAPGVAACEATASGTAPRPETVMNHVSEPAANYSFYAVKERGGNGAATPQGDGSGRDGRSVFSGGPDRPSAPNPDPYAFPSRGRRQPAWNGTGPYGNEPVMNW